MGGFKAAGQLRPPAVSDVHLSNGEPNPLATLGTANVYTEEHPYQQDSFYWNKPGLGDKGGNHQKRVQWYTWPGSKGNKVVWHT